MSNKHDNTVNDVLKLFGSLSKPSEKKNPDVPSSIENLVQLTRKYKESYKK